jgi:uncharacterized circularly permuted ATP-grasp superfamily protein/uncharacterized alpha-E superfamily protein
MGGLFSSLSGEAPGALARELAAAARAGHWDELRGRVSDGQRGGDLTPSWQRFFELLGSEGFAGLERRQGSLQQQILEDGVTYNVHADSDQASRSWSLDLFPLIIDPPAWARIAAGAAQRAALLNAVLDDVYSGQQRVLRQGLLPAALVQGHPGYLRAVQGHRPAGSVWLHIAAFDLARGPDGEWRVVNQRVQAPSGLGYLLQNRLLISRLFPQAFAALRVQRLAASYRLLMDTVQRLAPRGGDGDARIVLLTPGPYSETYFEQVYLARYLGITLAEGSDLTVREDRLFLKTVRGLEPVHAMLRRLDDSFCDPLELRPDSMLGVPGLLQAVRAGKVLLANALGAGFLESPALQGFMPKLCESLLGQPLQLPSLPTWWCGEQGVCEAPLQRLAEWVVKPVHAQCDFEATVMAGLGPAELEVWRARAQRKPEQITLQQYLPLPQVPVWSEGRMHARAAMLRVYALSDGAGGWRVLPGGLVRTASPGGNTVSMQAGGGSQDAWVITRDAVDRSSLLPAPIRAQDLAERHRVVTSRAAENLFWLGRYCERAEHATQLARLALRAIIDDDDLEGGRGDMLDRWCRASGLVPEAAEPLAQDPARFGRAIVAGLGGGEPCFGLPFSLQSLGRAASQVRERLGSDHRQWIAAATALRLTPRGGQATAADALRGLEQLAQLLGAITGAQTDRMTRDDGWRLLSIGRHIERLGLLGQSLGTAFETGAVYAEDAFNQLLELFDSTITYRALYQKRLDIPPLLDLLMLDRENPRSLGWVTQTLRARLAKLPGQRSELDELRALAPDPEVWQLPELCSCGADQRHASLERTLAHAVEGGWRLADEISRRYFAHAMATDRSLGVY